MTSPDDAASPATDGDPTTVSPKSKSKGRKPKQAIPTWSSAIPENLNFDDPLELAATLGPAAVGIALVQVLSAVGIKPLARASIIGQLAGQLKALVPTRRTWEAERAVRGEQNEIENINPGPKTEANPLKNASRAETVSAASGTKAVRGRPRKRALL